MRVKPVTMLLVALWIVLAGFGTAGVIERLLYGHRLAAYTSYVPGGCGWPGGHLLHRSVGWGHFCCPA